MSVPAESEQRDLSAIADELCEESAARGYRVGKAMDTDPAFARRHCQSSLTRGLVEDAIFHAAERLSIERCTIPGGGFELSFMSGFHERRYRIRRGTRRLNGSLHVPRNNSCSLTPTGADPDEPRLIEIDQWILAWIAGEDGQIADVVAADLVDVISGSPGRYVFGRQISLVTRTDSFVGAFRPTDEDLQGFEEHHEDYRRGAS